MYEGKDLMNLPLLYPIPSHWAWMNIHLYWQLGFRTESTTWVPLWDNNPQSWCVSQPFTRLFWDWYNWWASWLLPGIWTWLAPGDYSRFWDLASCWNPVYWEHPTWIKVKLPWTGGLSLDIHTNSSSFKILLKYLSTPLWDVPIDGNDPFSKTTK